ncbi:hypothetical protein EVAR_25352_1 [Eumeta japonica]|uniref:Uncharacterized protein n=1 Tax=Eumeta variegata TaxID=151549 RepID=A0A4C1XWP3_EUMVA|nr:hypothetical protein EVAR_25352_1 [Eumeta japonica]
MINRVFPSLLRRRSGRTQPADGSERGWLELCRSVVEEIDAGEYSRRTRPGRKYHPSTGRGLASSRPRGRKNNSNFLGGTEISIDTDIRIELGRGIRDNHALAALGSSFRKRALGETKSNGTSDKRPPRPGRWRRADRD